MFFKFVETIYFTALSLKVACGFNNTSFREIACAVKIENL